MTNPAQFPLSMPTGLPLPLDGLRVLDATHIVAGPFCSLILADMGAEVIKIERPRTGDIARGRTPFITDDDGNRMSSRFLGVNRNKKSVSIDLRNPRCRQAFENLVAASDVLVDNWGSGAFRRLGLGYDRLSEINPGLIYASITGYGDSEGLTGPYSNWPANNMAIQAMAGWMEMTGDPDGRPQAVGDNIGDSIPGLWAALSIVLALETRRKTGRGQHIDVAMYECMVSHIESNMNHYHATGEAPMRSHDRMATAGVTFRVKDGYVVLAGARSEVNDCAPSGRPSAATTWPKTPDTWGANWAASSSSTSSFRPSSSGRSTSPSWRWRRSWWRWDSRWEWRRPWRTSRTAPSWRAAGCTLTPATPSAGHSGRPARLCASPPASTRPPKRPQRWDSTTARYSAASAAWNRKNWRPWGLRVLSSSPSHARVIPPPSQSVSSRAV